MIRITLYREHGRRKGFTVKGHSGYSEAGTDIICAAVTSAVRYAECMINDILHADAGITVNDNIPEIQLFLPSDIQKKHQEAEKILDGFALYMKTLAEENPTYIQYLEG